MSRFTLLAVALGLLSFASGCCGGPCGRGLTSYNYNPVYPTAYAPTYSTASYAAPGCSSCGPGIAAF